jgi:hypothetical protein
MIQLCPWHGGTVVSEYQSTTVTVILGVAGLISEQICVQTSLHTEAVSLRL